MLLACKTAVNQPNNNNKINPGLAYHFFVILLVQSAQSYPAMSQKDYFSKEKVSKNGGHLFSPYYPITSCLAKR